MEKRASQSSNNPLNTGGPSSSSLSQVLAQSQKSKSGSNQPSIDKTEGPTAVRSRNTSGIKKSNSQSNINQTNGSAGGTFSENDTFNKHYNKELRVSKDEIPIVLGELNDSAIQFIKREQWEKALNLLQKAYGIMDVVDFQLCRRDKFNLFILFHNMALCYQKLQMLEECAQCIEQALEYMPADQFNLEERSVSNRMRKLQIICKLKLQYCAILSQVHRHKDALYQSKEGVKISHHLSNDLRQLCEFYIKREDIEQSYKDNVNMSTAQQNNNMNSRNFNQFQGNNESENMYNSYRSQRKERKMNGQSSRNRSFCQFLSQQEAYNSDVIFHQSSVTSQLKNSGFPQRSNLLAQDNMSHNLSSFYSLNFLEESMSYLEKTARKLHPILLEIKRKMVPEKTLKEKIRRISQGGMIALGGKSNKIETLDSVLQDGFGDIDSSQLNDISDSKKIQPDMKNILGYLNQGEWTQTLSIGSIMQLQPFQLKDLLEQGKNELELTRESFIQKVCLLAVSYFCYSTEIRFIIQMKEDPNYDPQIKQKESEYWHAKSLELACSFLPSECPLLNHINLSYQKHFAPVKQTILEEEVVTDDLKVVKPLNGIDNPKFQPIIRSLQNINVAITPYQMTPLNQVTSHFLSQMVSFNEYQESSGLTNHQISIKQQNNSIHQANLSQSHIKSKSGDISTAAQLANHKRVTTDIFQPNKQLEKYLQPVQNNSTISQIPEEDDMQKFEKLFEKLVKENKIDKSELFKKLQINSSSDGGVNRSTSGVMKNVLEERESILSNDMLLDDQIMNEEDSQQIMDDEEHVALEANHLTASNNLYKFRNPEADRPKTSQGTQNRANNEEKLSQLERINQYHKHVEEKKKSGARPLSGGLQQKLRTEQQKSRVKKVGSNAQNISMYDKLGFGGSPDRNINQYTANIGPKTLAQNQSQYISSNQPPQPNQSAGLSNLQPQQKSKLNYLVHHQSSQSQQQPSMIIQNKINQSAPIDQKKTTTDPNNLQAYDELKKRLLSEYKKLTSGKKTFDEQVREKYKNLKQRAVSGKKTQSQHQIPHPQPTQAATSSQSQQPANQFVPQQLSPRHHLNVYKPTFIINNSFAGENAQGNPGGQPSSKDIEILDEISKKYRPSSKQGQQQPTAYHQQQQQNVTRNAVSIGHQSQSLNPQQSNQPQLQSYINERSFQNVVPPPSHLIGNPQLLGLLINGQDKKSIQQHQSQPSLTQQQQSSSSGQKKSLKAHLQQQDPTHSSNYLKTYINQQQPTDQKTSSTSQILALASQHKNQAPSKALSGGYSTQSQFNQFQQIQQQQLQVQQYPLGAGGSSVYKQSIEQKQQQRSSSNGGQGMVTGVAVKGASNSVQQYEKIKKKLNNY